ncbi:MAG TPA: DUF2142 domain-containing protein [Anaerolineales bacterium]|nr:DUF2142 domain-containing protein [Anaerolineales bacterium]
MNIRVKHFFLEHGHLHAAEIYLIIVLFVFGTLACFLLPVNGGYDEEEHLIRVWEMSDYTFLPNEKLGNELPFPRVYREMSYRREFIVRAVPADFWEKYGNLSLDSMDYIYNADTRSVYSPPLLLPQALVMRFLGQNQQLPALTVYYACRLAGLLSYILLSLLAVRLIPYGKWTLAVIASIPVAILQSATVTPDTISNGIALLFIGGTLAAAKRGELHWRELIALMVLMFVLFWGKINIVPLALLPFLVIPPSQFKVKHGYFILLSAALVFFLLEVAGWNLFAYSRYYDAITGADPSGQVKFILADPIRFMGILADNIRLSYADYLRAWIAIYGLDYWPVPIWTFYLYSAALLGALLIQENENTPDRRLRIGLLITFIAAYVWTIVSLYLSFTPVGSDVVRGVQGRYFSGVMPLLFLALACLPILKQIRIPVYLPLVLGGLSLVLYITGMYLSYHVTCGSQYYTGGLCYQPNYKNWAPNEVYSAPISADLSLRQEVIAECNGMTEFRVWLDASASNPTGITEFSLVDADTGRVVVSSSVSNTDLPRKTWYTLTFTPVMDSLGKLYLFNIRVGSGDGQGPRIAYSLKQEYIEGNLYENSDDINRDVIFQMGCLAGWKK